MHAADSLTSASGVFPNFHAPPVALTVAGVDPSGGAGVVADVRTFLKFGCFAAAAVTSLTFQNTTKVFGASHQTAETVCAQIVAVAEDLRIAAAKTGMLPTAEIVAEVARLVDEKIIPAPVVDTVVRATTGRDLIEPAAVEVLKRELIPRARLITPNAPEAELLTGERVESVEDMRRAAGSLIELGARAALIKGGHLPGGAESIDLLLDEDGSFHEFRAERVKLSRPTHGAGCALSAAITALVAHNVSLLKSIEVAKRFVTKAILVAPQLGRGALPLNHLVGFDYEPELSS